MSPSWPSSNDRSSRTESCLRARRGLCGPRSLQLTPEQQRLLWLDYTTLRCAPRALDAAAKWQAVRPEQRLAGLHESSARTCSPRRDRRWCCWRGKRTSPAPPGAVARRRGARGCRPREAGPVGHHQYRSSVDSVPHLFDPPRPAPRRCGACSSCAATTATSTTTTSPRSCSSGRAGEALGYPRTPTGASRTNGEDAGARGGLDGSGVEARRGARPRRGGRHAGHRRPEKPASASLPGTTASMPRRCARRGTTSTRTT